MRALTFLSALTAGAVVLTGCSAPEEQKPKASQTPAAEQADPASDGVGKTDRDKAKAIVEKMSDDELIGATIMATFDGTDPQTAGELIKKHSLSGAIIMDYNVPEGADEKQMTQFNADLRTAAGQRSWPIQLSVDQEGGPVARVRSATYRFPPLMAFGAAQSPELTQKSTALQGRQLVDEGFTIDWAPVADTTIGAADPAINLRSAGGDQAAVAKTVEPAVSGYLEAGIGSSAKHFPGHGHLTVDSHVELPSSDKTLKEYRKTEWKPFEAAAEAGAPTMLVGHMKVKGAGDKPASLNPKVYDALRKDVGFDGVAVTDGLNMGAITKGTPAGQETVQALKAGADLALMPPDLDAAVSAVRKAIESGDLPKKDMQKKAERVVAMALWQKRAREASQVDRSHAEDTFNEAARSALTVLSGECEAEPVKSISITGESSAKEALTAAAKKKGIAVGSGTTVELVDGTQSSKGSKADVVVGMGAPWKVAQAGSKTVLVSYTGNEYAMNAVADYLAGDLSASGRSPVKVKGAKPPKCG